MAPAPSTTATISATGKVDRITTYLWLSVLIFASGLVLVDKLFPNEGQVFQVIAGLATGFMGALLNRITPPHPSTPVAPAGSSTNGASAPGPTPVITLSSAGPAKPMEPQTRG